MPNNVVSVLDYGAVGDGVTDDTAAITAALAATAPSGIVYAPEGQYGQYPVFSNYLITNELAYFKIGNITFYVGYPYEKSNQEETLRISRDNTKVTGNLTVTGRIQDAMQSLSVTVDSQTVAISNTITVFRNTSSRTGTIFTLPTLNVDCSFKIISRGELVNSTFTLPAGDIWGNDPGAITIGATSTFCLYYVADRKEWYYST